MTVSLGDVYLSPGEEAQRLWDGAATAFQTAESNIADLSEAVDLGVRVVEIALSCNLRAVRDEFPKSIASLLDSPPPEVDPERDFVHPPRSLRFIDAVDMMLESDLPCISSELHHGWEDRFASCQRARLRTKRMTGISLNEQQRDDLMLIGAYRNRIFVLPPPVRIVPADLLRAFPTLTDLVKHLFSTIPASCMETV